MRIKPIEMRGVAELDRRFAALGTAMATDIADDALGASAQLMAGAWVEVAPYGPGRAKTHTLKSGERRSKNYGHGRDLIKAQRAKSRRPHRLVWRVSTNDAFWLFFYEYGKFDQPARPTFRPMTERMLGRCVDLQTQIVRTRVAEVWDGRSVNATGRNA